CVGYAFANEHLSPHRRDHSADTWRDHLFRRAAAWRRRRRQDSWLRTAARRHQVRKFEREFQILFSHHHVDRLVDRPDIDHAALLLKSVTTLDAKCSTPARAFLLRADQAATR